MPKKLGVLLSGRGSNFEAINKAIHNKHLEAEIACVITNKPDAQGLKTAQDLKIPAFCLDTKNVASKTHYEEQIVTLLKQHECDLIVLAGYMRLIGKTLLDAYPNRILNIHPSLLPAFKGLNAQKQALDYGVKVAGCSVHIVNEEMDGGKILAQCSVDVLENDTEDSLSKRILDKEHQVYPQTIQTFLKNLV